MSVLETPFWDRVYLCALPALTLTLVVVAHMMRMTRAAIINLLASPYIEMANLKGMSRSRIIVRHALPNALAPIINVIVINLAYLIVGVVLVEVVFVYPGLGQLIVNSVANRDIPVVQACSLIFAATYVLLNLTADILSIVTNPRLLASEMTDRPDDTMGLSTDAARREWSSATGGPTPCASCARRP